MRERLFDVSVFVMVVAMGMRPEVAGSKAPKILREHALNERAAARGNGRLNGSQTHTERERKREREFEGEEDDEQEEY
jgi:hypothetical protein